MHIKTTLSCIFIITTLNYNFIDYFIVFKASTYITVLVISQGNVSGIEWVYAIQQQQQRLWRNRMSMRRRKTCSLTIGFWDWSQHCNVQRPIATLISIKNEEIKKKCKYIFMKKVCVVRCTPARKWAKREFIRKLLA